MVKKKITKNEAVLKIEEFFSSIKSKTPKEIGKIKRLANSFRISLSERKKLFCSKCLTPYSGKEKIRIKNGFKSIVCLKCSYIRRIKL